MTSVIKNGKNAILVEGSTMRIASTVVKKPQTIGTENKPRVKNYAEPGIVSILPKVQVALGQDFSAFIKGLELSRIPLAVKKTTKNGEYASYDIVRLETGNIECAIIASASVYKDILIGITYNESIIYNEEFRKKIKLSAMHQIAFKNIDNQSKLTKASTYISVLTGLQRERLVIVETKRTLKVRVNYDNRLNLPLYYSFILDKSNTDTYRLLQIGYDFNDAVKSIKEKDTEC